MLLVERYPFGDKAYIRKEMEIKRNSISPEQRKLWSQSACAKAGILLESRSITAFMVYVSFRSELDLSSLIEWGWQTGRDVIAPRCIAEGRTMTLHYLRSWDDLMPGAYGIMEPNPAVTPPIYDGYAPDVVFVPGLAFDRQGGRLGYGGGYYDRFAETVIRGAGGQARTLWLGMSYEAQLMAKVPLEKHDLIMNGMITEQDVYLL